MLQKQSTGSEENLAVGAAPMSEIPPQAVSPHLGVEVFACGRALWSLAPSPGAEGQWG